MGPRNGRSCILLSALLAYSWILLSQQSGGNAPGGEHLPVGVWESNQPDGSVVGIDLASVLTSVPDAVYPERTPKPQGFRLQIGIFQRLHERIGCGDENFFVTGWTGRGSENASTIDGSDTVFGARSGTSGPELERREPVTQRAKS